MGKKVKFLIKDEETLILDEDASKGDYIVLRDDADLDTKSVVRNFDTKIRELAKTQAKSMSETQVLKAVSEKEKEIAQLNQQIKMMKEQQVEKIKIASADKEKEIAKLNQQLAQAQAKVAIAKQEVINSEEQWTRRYIATKTFGEALEKFIYTEYEDLKQKGAFINSDFWKDNKVIKSEDDLKGTKGDFIFVQRDDVGNDLLTVSVEVKTELNTTSKKKNRDHFDQLETNRQKKHCDYAILISELEKGNKVYDGIYKVPGKEKTYVVRPQTFFSLLSTLIDSLYKHNELLVKLKDRTARIENKEQFMKNIDAFAENFNKSKIKWDNNLDGIEATIIKSIKNLQDTLEHIKQSRKALEAGKNKVEGLTMRKLLRNCSEDLVFDDETEEKEEE